MTIKCHIATKSLCLLQFAGAQDGQYIPQQPWKGDACLLEFETRACCIYLVISFLYSRYYCNKGRQLYRVSTEKRTIHL